MNIQPKGWQTIKSACKKTDVSRQRIHQLIEAGIIAYQTLGRDIWVPDPLGYKPDRSRQKRARIK